VPQVQVYNRSFLRGLETTREEGGAPDFGGFRTFLNSRVGDADAERRPGMAVISRITEPATSMHFTGGEITLYSNPEVWALDRPAWLLEALIEPENPTANLVLINNGVIKIEQSSGNWVVTVGGATLSAPLTAGKRHLAVSKDESALSLLIDGTVADTATWGALGTLAPATVVGAPWQGFIDFLRLRAIPAIPSVAQRELRLLNPRSRRVLLCLRDGPDTNEIVWDRSVFECHGRSSGSVESAPRISSVPHNPVQLIRTYLDENDRRRLFVVAGGKEHDAAY